MVKVLDVGVCFASTGGNKLVRAIRSLRNMEPNLPIHAVMSTDTNTFRCRDRASDRALDIAQAEIHAIDKGGERGGFVNSGMNAAIDMLRKKGYAAACIFHDDVVFSPLESAEGSISHWFHDTCCDWSQSSGVSFGHWELLAPTHDLRRPPSKWDMTDLESSHLWKDLRDAPRVYPGSPVAPFTGEHFPDRADFFVRYEGTDQKCIGRRLGPTGFIIPIALWESLGHFSETDGVFYDEAWSAECFIRGLPPIWQVPNAPYLHLHNQSCNPWADVAVGIWGDSDGAFKKRFGLTLREFWRDDWPARWAERAKTTATG